jgi:hypothetical protein
VAKKIFEGLWTAASAKDAARSKMTNAQFNSNFRFTALAAWVAADGDEGGMEKVFIGHICPNDRIG